MPRSHNRKNHKNAKDVEMVMKEMMLKQKRGKKNEGRMLRLEKDLGVKHNDVSTLK